MLEQPNTSTDSSPILKTPIQTSPATQSEDISKYKSFITTKNLIIAVLFLEKGSWNQFKKFLQRNQKTLLLIYHVMMVLLIFSFDEIGISNSDWLDVGAMKSDKMEDFDGELNDGDLMSWIQTTEKVVVTFSSLIIFSKPKRKEPEPRIHQSETHVVPTITANTSTPVVSTVMHDQTPISQVPEKPASVPPVEAQIVCSLFHSLNVRQWKRLLVQYKRLLQQLLIKNGQPMNLLLKIT